MITMIAQPETVLPDPAQASPDHLGSTYRQLVLDRIEERGLVVDRAVDDRSSRMAGEIARRSGSSADVVELHVASLRRLTGGVEASRAKALLDAGEHVLLLTLGHLAEHYRSLAQLSA